MSFDDFNNMPLQWKDYEDIAMALYDKFGQEFGTSQIYRIRFTDLMEWVLSLPNFTGTKEDCNEGHLEQIQAHWAYEWKNNHT